MVVMTTVADPLIPVQAFISSSDLEDAGVAKNEVTNRLTLVLI